MYSPITNSEYLSDVVSPEQLRNEMLDADGDTVMFDFNDQATAKAIVEAVENTRAHEMKLDSEIVCFHIETLMRFH